MLALIVAKAANDVIGNDNKLIWHLPKDLKFFKEKTTGHVIIMGRKTFESLPFLLPHREHWVITKNAAFSAPEGVKVFTSPEEAAQAAAQLEAAYVIGGAQIYKAFMPLVDRMYVTEIDHEFEGDAFFPPIDESQFVRTHVEEGQVDEKHPYPFRFVTYERKV